MSNGTIKKIDELGRIVIPRSIRKSLSIKKDDSLEIGIVDNSIRINKTISIVKYDEKVMKYAQLFSDCRIKMIVTNREKVIFNNTNINDINVLELIELSLYDLINKGNSICAGCDIRPIVIDSNNEGIVIVCDSVCNEIVGELFNKIVTTELDITC